jgi:hypothetical protein
MGRIIAIEDDLAYCVFPGWGRRTAIGIPIEIFGGKIDIDLRFFVQMRMLGPGGSAYHHEDFQFSDWELNHDQSIPTWEELGYPVANIKGTD